MIDLHPALEEWFSQRYSEPAEIQRLALPHCAAGRNTLILAPTGSGKTLAGFLALLSRLGQEAEAGRLGNEVRAVYVSPLKALAYDIARNLQPPLEALNRALPERRRIRLEIRTGDTTLAGRAKMQRRKPHLLLTTPESLSSLLSQSGWLTGFRPAAVVVDEIHAFAENKRGSLLALSLERLESRCREPVQRIGLSATAYPVSAVTQFLCGRRPCEVAQVDLRKTHRLDIASPPKDMRLPLGGYSTYWTAPLAAELVRTARCTLVFTSTRSAAEQLGLALKILLPEFDENIEVHHGSIGKAVRLDIEGRLSQGAMKAVVCSTSLELGVDFQAVDQVLLAGTPRGISRALQRLGRAGHRVGGVAAGSVVPLSLPDLLEAAALCEAARKGRLDALRVPAAPLDVLAQVLLGMSVERRWGLDDAFGTLRRAGPYLGLQRNDFDAVIEYLAGGGRVLGPYGTYGKIRIAEDSFEVASRRGARDYYVNIGAISDDFQIKVVGRNGRRLGEVEESFLNSLQPGEAFIIGGRSVRLRRLHRDMAVVEPAEGEAVKTPRWMGGKMNLSARLAEEEVSLRRTIRSAWERGGADAVRKALRSQWKVPDEPARRVAAYVARQCELAPVPVDSPVLIERVRRGVTLQLLFHSVASRDVNRSLAWVLGHRFARDQKKQPGVVANFDDHAFLLSIDARLAPDETKLRGWFSPVNWREDLDTALKSTETLGRKFRDVAETGQLLPRQHRQASWSASLLYSTFLKYEPNHPLVREAIREVLEDQLDAARAAREAQRIFQAPWEVVDLPRHSIFALPLMALFHREVMQTQDADAVLAGL